MKINKYIKIVILLILLLIIMSVVIFSINIIIKKEKRKEIHTIHEILLENNIQNNAKEESKLSISFSKYENVIGIIKIDEIKFEGIIYEGTDIETLEKGVGHFKNSPTFEGNVCLAAHNSREFWANLNKIKINDVIHYSCILGTRKYTIFNIQEIKSTDWSLLQDTDENIITLITCIKDTPSQRLCVQAKEVI